MEKLASMTALALLISVGCVYAADNQLSPTTNPSSSGRPSAILNDSECQNIWKQALNQSETGSAGSMGSNTGSSSSNTGSAGSNLSDSSSAQSPSGTAGSSASNLGASSGSNSASADSGQSGMISKQQAVPYVANFAMVDKNSDGQISMAEFQDGCKNGWVQTASSNGSNSSGANKSGTF